MVTYLDVVLQEYCLHCSGNFVFGEAGCYTDCTIEVERCGVIHAFAALGLVLLSDLDVCSLWCDAVRWK